MAPTVVRDYERTHGWKYVENVTIIGTLARETPERVRAPDAVDVKVDEPARTGDSDYLPAQKYSPLQLSQTG